MLYIQKHNYSAYKKQNKKKQKRRRAFMQEAMMHLKLFLLYKRNT